MAKPWMTSADLIESVKRKIAVPIHQVTFSDNDILAFANEEMFISQVPSIMEFHEEFYVTKVGIKLQTGINRYPVPNRAIGMKLRDSFYGDGTPNEPSLPWGNLFEMTRILPSDQAFFQKNVGANTAIHKFFMEGNDVVLTPMDLSNPQGYLVLSFYMRPNQLVTVDRAATIQSFQRTLTISGVASGDSVTIGDTTFVAGTDFAIGLTDDLTASNLLTAINTAAIINPSTVSGNVITLDFDSGSALTITSEQASISVSNNLIFVVDQIPSHFAAKMEVDFLQTKPGHKIMNYDIKIPVNGISGLTITFPISSVPKDMTVGDYVCAANEAIIPQLPPDLHTALAERCAARILASLGDQQGLADSNAKLAEIEKRQGTLIDDRVEGAPIKILNRYSLLRLNKQGTVRRF